MQIKRHYWKATIKSWEWHPENNEVKEIYKDVEKDFTNDQLNKHIRREKLAILGYLILGMFVGCLGFCFNWVAGLIGIAIVGVIFLALSILFYWLNNCKDEYFYNLGYEDGVFYSNNLKIIFKEEIEEELNNKLMQEKLAEKWRKKHPLEEKIRLALTKNPNYIADLIRYYCELDKSNKNIKN